jgi:hypothetical protein
MSSQISPIKSLRSSCGNLRVVDEGFYKTSETPYELNGEFMTLPRNSTGIPQFCFIDTVLSVLLAEYHWVINPITITMVVLIAKSAIMNSFVRNVLDVAHLFHEVLKHPCRI